MRDSTVNWIFFKDLVDDVRASVERFHPNEVALQRAWVSTKPLVNQRGEELYNSGDYEFGLVYLASCGFTDARTRMWAKMATASTIMKPE
jgi:hypothetical protein